jgi:hypothetical protein
MESMTAFARPLIVSLLTATVLGTAAVPATAQPTGSVWEASSGLTPDQICPAWTLSEDAPGADPTLAGGVLTLSTAANGEDMLYIQWIASPAPNPIVIEARLQLISGSSSASNRGPAAIVVTTAPNTGTLFFLGIDDIFLTADGDVRGPSASVDTDGAPHTYRIEITAAGAITVAYDGVPTLTGNTYVNAGNFGADPRIIWGEGSGNAFGTHVWTSFRHNAAVCQTGTTSTVTTSSTTSSTGGIPTTSPTSSLPITTSTATSTTSPSGGSSSTSTTSTPGATTTSTTATLPPGCDDVRPGSLEALRCRLDILDDRVGSAAGLGNFRPKLSQNVDRSINFANQAASLCAANDTKKAAKRMKQIQKQLQKMTHRMSGLAARKQLDAGLRADLVRVIESIRTDVGALRKNPCD